MGLATQSSSSVQFTDNNLRRTPPPPFNSMSQDYNHQAAIFNFSNSFDRSQQPPPPPPPPPQTHLAQQLRRDKLRVQGFDPPPPLAGLHDDPSSGMLSEMFGFPPTATELLDSQILSTYRRHPSGTDWPSSAAGTSHHHHHTAAAPAPHHQYHFKNLASGNNNQMQQMGIGSSSSSSSYGAMSLLRNSKYAKAAQELLEEFCSVGRGQFRKSKLRRWSNNDNGNPSSAGGGGNSSSSSKEVNPPLSAADRLEHQRRKVKLLSMLDEVDRRYNHYCEQMQMVVNSFDMVMGFGSAGPYTSLAQKAMSRHFRCLKDSIASQLKQSCEALGEKDASSSGVTKGETPRLRMLEQSLRQQRAFQQMGMMEQEAWRPQRGLPERSVNILRAWLFEHFLHPYPTDADKHLLARQTGLSRNQVSNWFINARVRLWKPMVEEMYQQEAKEEETAHEDEEEEEENDNNNTISSNYNNNNNNNDNSNNNRDQISSSTGQNPTIYNSSAPNEGVDGQANDPTTYAGIVLSDAAGAPVSENPFPAGNTDDIEATLIRFGAGDVSLTLGLRHAGNLPEKGPFSVRDFGGC
ncbi:BEL1-like homeodomain protein 2 [Striga hermonthica]|uniref:BEL1-like homeodomain protein 2 n=1 Tax=Striga hermonthica TaxID=68872 RepID=A0A9N7NQQ6_STRHE|nr:BEL1-like homeodomain protein 2 [Striga hermonthica]